MLSLPSDGGAGPGPAGKAKSVEGDEMVQDPHCKVYVPLGRAVKRKIGGETVHFCSEECANNYVKGIGKG